MINIKRAEVDEKMCMSIATAATATTAVSSQVAAAAKDARRHMNFHMLTEIPAIGLFPFRARIKILDVD